ncbi:unnamed protein product [Owenia fusiformis]|uniref:Uncharacterized protein n=1 Tax=Owenia fusiformis TaxID=6347 RepID=A0A8J1XQZ6_OWEFU|nr:unnamed protein product [Owenia fusiformis]
MDNILKVGKMMNETMDNFPFRQILSRMFETILNSNSTNVNMTSMIKPDIALDGEFYSTTVSQLNEGNETEGPDKKMIMLIMTIVVFCFPIVTILFVIVLRMHLKWREGLDAQQGLMRGTFELSSIITKSSRQNTLKVRMDLDDASQEAVKDKVAELDSNGEIMDKNNAISNSDTDKVKNRQPIAETLPSLLKENSPKDSGVDFSPLSPGYSTPDSSDNKVSVKTRFNFDTAVIEQEMEIH